MKKLIKNLMVFTFGLLLYPVSASAADTYSLDMEWYEENSFNTDFMTANFECGINILLLTKWGEEFFETENLLADDINHTTESMMKLMMFQPENTEQKQKMPLDITIYSDAIVVKDIDLVFNKDNTGLITKVEHRKKDVSDSFVFLNGKAQGSDGTHEYINYSWGLQDFGKIPTCWYKLNKL